MSRSNARPPLGRGGSVIVAVAVSALLFVGLLALVVDVGSWYADRTRVQTLADLGVESVLRRFPGEPTGDSAKAHLLELFHVNGLRPHALDLAASGSSLLELEVAIERPRYFSSSRRLRSVNLVVQARAQRSALGEVALVP